MKTINLEQAAAFLHLHKDTVQQRAAAGIIPGYKPGRRWVFDEDELAAYLKNTGPKCRSTSAPTARSIGAGSKSAEEKLDALLAERFAKRPRKLKLVTERKF